MEVHVVGENISQDELTAEMGWQTARSRRSEVQRGKNPPLGNAPSSQNSLSSSKPEKNIKSQVLKAGRMPQLPKDEIRIIVRPKGGLNINKVGSLTVTAAIFQATQLTPEERQHDTICPNVQQNIVVVSTPRQLNAEWYVRMKSIQVNGVIHEINAYKAAPDNTTKGVIRGIPLTENAQMIDANIVNDRNPLALAAKRIASTTAVIIAFDGPRVPRLVRYGATLIPCSLYRKQIDICYQCGRLGHRMDVCPHPDNKICRCCGVRNPDREHQCSLKCTLCGGSHLTADKTCNAKYKTPYVIRKRLWERRMAQESSTQPNDPPLRESKKPSRSRSRPGAGRSRSRSRSTPRGHPTTDKVSFAEAVQGVSREGPIATPTPTPPADNAVINELRKENAALRDLINKLTQEVQSLKQDRSQATVEPPETSSSLLTEESLTPAPKKRALRQQDGSFTGQARSEIKDMLTSLQGAVENLQTVMLALTQRVTALESNFQSVVAAVNTVTPSVDMDTSGVNQHSLAQPLAVSSTHHHGSC
ncbi:hypothetical protein HPB52_023535 [Rhipicephalus sanguineus]|uniref:CCHC-type domain-containing protein n=1 Tax=Rhipicephalus sanguineus TaxID=34632 RepID=A0A9D4PGX8_RHISA|nr:hypothetical protein HPB52_023535 [Rhipicephalus sanguineus]